MSTTGVNTIDDWLNELDKLIKNVSSGITILRKTFSTRQLYQIFQAYVYALSIEAIKDLERDHHSINVQIYVMSSVNGQFIFKISPRGYYSNNKYSYFKITLQLNNKDHEFYALMNIDTSVGIPGFYSTLNLDIAFVDQFLSDQMYIPRKRVISFIECKSVNHATPEHIATVYGQSFLVKRSRGRSHPYNNIPDILAVRGSVSQNVINLSNMIRSWNRPITHIARIAPLETGVNRLKTFVKEIVKLAYSI